MTKLVRLAVSASMACWVTSSVRVSTLLVGLVEDQHRVILYHGPGDGQQLLLSGGDRNGVVQYGVKALGQRLYEVVYAAGTAGLLELLVGDAGLVVHQVITHGALKEPGVLEHHAEHVVHTLAGQLVRGYAVSIFMVPPFTS